MRTIEAPEPGESVAITLELGPDVPLATVEGTVVEVVADPTVRSEYETGFSLQFRRMTASEQSDLEHLLNALRYRRMSA